MDSPDNDVKELLRLAKDERVVMMTAMSPDGGIDSKPMTVIELDGDGVFWFLCEHDPREVNPSMHYRRMNLAISNEAKSTFVSIQAQGEIIRDRRLRHHLWSLMAKPWFPDGPDSPSLVVLKVTPVRAEYWDSPNSRVVRALALAASILAGKPIGMGEHGVLQPNAAHPKVA